MIYFGAWCFEVIFVFHGWCVSRCRLFLEDDDDDDDEEASTTCRLKQSQFKNSLCILSAFVSTFDRPPRVYHSDESKEKREERRKKKHVDWIYNYSDHISMEIIIYLLLLLHHFVINDIPYTHQLLRWWWRHRRQRRRCDIVIAFPYFAPFRSLHAMKNAKYFSEKLLIVCKYWLHFSHVNFHWLTNT